MSQWGNYPLTEEYKLAQLLHIKHKNKEMKNYKKQKYSGNENGWHEPIVTLGVHSMHESQAETLNDQFRNTGIKYEETDILPHEFKKTTNDEANHGEPNLEVKDGKQEVKDPNAPKEKAKAPAKPKKASNKADKETKAAEHVDNATQQ